MDEFTKRFETVKRRTKMGLEIDYVYEDDALIYTGTIENQEDLKAYVDGGLDLYVLQSDMYHSLGIGRPANKVGFLFRLKEACEQACLLNSKVFDDVSDFTIGFSWEVDSAEPEGGEVLQLSFCKTHCSKFTGKPRIFANLQFQKETNLEIVSTKVEFVDSRGDCSFVDILEYTESLIDKICSLRIASTITGQGQVVEHYNRKLLTNIDTKEKFIEFVRKGLPLQWIEHKKSNGEESEDQPALETEGYRPSSIEVASKHKLLRQLNSIIAKEILPRKGIPESSKWQIEADNIFIGCFDVNPYVYFWHMDNSPLEFIFWIGDWRVIAYFPNRPEDYLRWISEEMVITDEDE